MHRQADPDDRLMPGIVVQVQGLNETVRALQRAGADVADLKEVFAGIAAEAARIAASFAPVRTGRLRATIRGNRAKNKAVVMAGRARVPYAGAINYGWRARNIRPSNFLQRVDEVMGTRAPQLLEQGLAEIVRRTES